jgi:hypothetical protein
MNKKATKKEIIIFLTLAFIGLFIVPFVLDVMALPWPTAVAFYIAMTRILLIQLFQIAVIALALPMIFYFAHTIGESVRRLQNKHEKS